MTQNRTRAGGDAGNRTGRDKSESKGIQMPTTTNAYWKNPERQGPSNDAILLYPHASWCCWSKAFATTRPLHKHEHAISPCATTPFLIVFVQCSKGPPLRGEKAETLEAPLLLVCTCRLYFSCFSPKGYKPKNKQYENPDLTVSHTR